MLERIPDSPDEVPPKSATYVQPTNAQTALAGAGATAPRSAHSSDDELREIERKIRALLDELETLRVRRKDLLDRLGK